MKLGFFGGTFNPPHKGHEQIIDYCLKSFDRLVLFPNIISPDKLSSPPIDCTHRINMLKLIIKNRNIEIDTYEIESKLSNYTYHTVKYLLNKYEDVDLFMIIGRDQLLNLKNWYNISFIMEHTNIMCFNRLIDQDNKTVDDLYSNVKIINFNFPFSSSYIRRNLYKNKMIDNSVISDKVKDYIYGNNLYK